jgi:hypothetical protein
MIDSKYLEFQRCLLAKNRKTYVVHVRAKRSGDYIGEIRWFPRWRQYCFFPEPTTVFSAGCMRDIIDYMEDLDLSKSRVTPGSML